MTQFDVRRQGKLTTIFENGKPVFDVSFSYAPSGREWQGQMLTLEFLVECANRSIEFEGEPLTAARRDTSFRRNRMP